MNLVLTQPTNLVTISQLVGLEIFFAFALGLINLRLANRFWSLPQAGKISHVMVHGLSLLLTFQILYIPHMFFDMLLTTPDRIFSLLIILSRFIIFVILFSKLSVRFAHWFVTEDKAALDCLPQFIGKQL